MAAGQALVGTWSLDETTAGTTLVAGARGFPVAPGKSWFTDLLAAPADTGFDAGVSVVESAIVATVAVPGAHGQLSFEQFVTTGALGAWEGLAVIPTAIAAGHGGQTFEAVGAVSPEDA